jgi:hypothetical protein
MAALGESASIPPDVFLENRAKERRHLGMAAIRFAMGDSGFAKRA